MRTQDIAIIGAGPYGLSLSAHLTARGIDHTLFGPPMAFWYNHMPPGMMLKSDDQSSDLPAPGIGFPIRHFLPERTLAAPISAEQFCAYGAAFQRALVPHADSREITWLDHAAGRFRLTLSDGETIGARRIVAAVGVGAFAHIPSPFANLPADRISHSVAYGCVDALAGRRVAILGSGASAVDIASALHEHGAEPIIVTRRNSLGFHHPPGPRKLRHRIRRPDTGIGSGWDLWFYANFPALFHALPTAIRRDIIATALGPAPGWFMRHRIEHRVPVLTGMTVERLDAPSKGVALGLRQTSGITRRLEVDHVVAATGFRPDVARLTWIDPVLAAGIRTEANAPVLSRQFETTVPGLYMIGPVAAPSFGPVMRFVFGAGKTTAGLARHLAANPATAIRVAAPQQVMALGRHGG